MKYADEFCTDGCEKLILNRRLDVVRKALTKFVKHYDNLADGEKCGHNLTNDIFLEAKQALGYSGFKKPTMNVAGNNEILGEE